MGIADLKNIIPVGKLVLDLVIELEQLKQENKLDMDSIKKPVIMALDGILKVYGVDLIPESTVEEIADMASGFDFSKVKLPDLGGK